MDPAVVPQVHTATDAPPTVESASGVAPREVDFSFPTQPVVSLDSLALAYVIVLNSLAETLYEHTAPVDGDADSQAMTRRRREICAAVWAANRAALDASNLSGNERALMNKLVWRRLHVHWKSFCGSSEEGAAWLESRSTEYLRAQVRASAVTAASHIVKMLFDAIGSKENGASAHSRVLASLVGHRIISEVNHLNELKSQFRFV
jgi:hypothetical protein